MVADVSRSLIRADFFAHFGLLVDIQGGKLITSLIASGQCMHYNVPSKSMCQESHWRDAEPHVDDAVQRHNQKGNLARQNTKRAILYIATMTGQAAKTRTGSSRYRAKKVLEDDQARYSAPIEELLVTSALTTKKG